MRFKEILPGMVFKYTSTQFRTVNYVRVLRVGNRFTQDIIYVLFVDPSDYYKKRLNDDFAWSVWDFMYNEDVWEYMGRLL